MIILLFLDLAKINKTGMFITIFPGKNSLFLKSEKYF